MAGAAVLCVPAVLSRLTVESVHSGRGLDGFASWAAVVAVVAVAEEAFLRGALYAALAPTGRLVAVGAPAVAFALLHVPLYGWAAVPLDLAVGLWLGALRAATGTFLAPAVAHTVADWAAWWLV